MSRIMTSAGRVVTLAEITPEEITIEEIAHSLSNLCRFGGHTKKFYSVAQHSIEVSKDLPFGLAFEGLMHDAAEAYMLDLPSPIKRLMPGYQEMEDRIYQVIADKYNLQTTIPDLVKKADQRALVTEFHNLFDGIGDNPFLPSGIDPKGNFTPPYTPDQAKMAFLERFNMLWASRNAES